MQQVECEREMPTHTVPTDSIGCSYYCTHNDDETDRRSGEGNDDEAYTTSSMMAAWSFCTRYM